MEPLGGPPPGHHGPDPWPRMPRTPEGGAVMLWAMVTGIVVVVARVAEVVWLDERHLITPYLGTASVAAAIVAVAAWWRRNRR